jgi:WXG100 family type VII secretion target
MSDEIQCNYDELEQISSQFGNQSQSIQDMQQKVRASYAKLLDKGWIGLGATAYFDEMEQDILPAQERLKDALEQAGQATQQIADFVKTAEEDASGLFR